MEIPKKGLEKEGKKEVREDRNKIKDFGRYFSNIQEKKEEKGSRKEEKVPNDSLRQSLKRLVTRKGKEKERGGDGREEQSPNTLFDKDLAMRINSQIQKMTMGDEFRTADDPQELRLRKKHPEKIRNWSTGAQKADSTQSDVLVHSHKDLPDLPEVESPLAASPISNFNEEKG
jgi:hypothetical protein